MDNVQKEAVEQYQCLGCVYGSDTECFRKTEEDLNNLACAAHSPGTRIAPSIGLIFLGLPTGFNRLGPVEEMKINIFRTYEDSQQKWVYDEFDIPVWKHLDKHGHTLVRGLSPRINRPWIHIFLGDYRSKIDCFEVDQALIDQMD